VTESPALSTSDPTEENSSVLFLDELIIVL